MSKDRNAKRRAVSAYKLRTGCKRCGVSNIPPHELHMDHLPGHLKVNNVSDLISQDYSWVRIWDEVAKCQVLCIPCHTDVTRERQDEAKPSTALLSF